MLEAAIPSEFRKKALAAAVRQFIAAARQFRVSLSNYRLTRRTLVAALACATPSLCTAALWDINWSAGTGDWATASNWSGAFGPMVPGEGDYAFIDNGGTAQVQTTPSDAVDYLFVGNLNSGTLEISNGAQLSNNYYHAIGVGVGSNGGVTVDGVGSSLLLEGPSARLIVGSYGTGSLTITNGGTVSQNVSYLFTYIGEYAGSNGTVTVDGAGSSLTYTNASITVGHSGSGTLNIINNGSVNLANGLSVVLGSSSGSNGTLNIGNGGAAGILNAAEVDGRHGTATLNFNHNNANYFFTDDGTSLGDTVIIRGTTSVNSIGSGTTYISGSNTYTGSTNINSGKLVVYNSGALGNNSAVTVAAGAMLESLDNLAIGSLAGGGTVKLDTGSGGYILTVGGDNTSTLFSGVITDDSYLTKIGSGTLTLSGNNTYTGATVISNGRLVVNGSIANSGITVNAGGALGGSGTLGSITLNGGTLAPGNSIGTMNVAGNVNFAGGVYQVEVDAAGNSDHINAAGSAVLTNGSVLVLPEAGNYRLSTDYTILTAAGGLGGTTFNSVSSNLAFLTPTLTYDANNVLLNLSRNSTEYASVAETANQSSVGTALDTLFSSGTTGADELFNNLNILSAAGAKQAYDALSGVQHTYSNQIALQSLNQFKGLLFDRLQGNSQFLASNGQLMLAYNDNGTVTDVGSQLLGSRPVADRGWWLRGTGSYGEIDGTANASGAHYNASGTATGIDFNLDDSITLGAAFGYSTTGAGVEQGDLEVDSYQTAFYGRWLLDDGYYASGMAGLGYHDIDAKRGINVGVSSSTAKADYDAWTGNLAVEAGRTFALNERTRITPLAGLEYAHINRDNFTERGAGAADLHVSSDQQDSLRSALGARLEHTWVTRNGSRIQPTVELAWLHEFMDNEAALRAGFAPAPTATFNVSGPELDRDRARLGLGLNMQVSETASLSLGYQGEFASSDNRHDISATFKMVW
jgi:fibronectin-binding autotransporter adhesin